MSKVVFLEIKEVNKENVQKTVKKAMNLSEWKKYINGKKLFVKINGISDQLVPGQCTSPWVIEAVLQELRSNLPKVEINIGDADLASTKQLNKAAKLWGVLDLAKKYNVKFINLSEDELIETDIGGEIFHNLLIPKSLLEADCIVNIPVLKTHGLTKITCALKNHWGCIPRFRHQYHLVVDKAIADINHFFEKTVFNIVDGTVCMEGDAPRTGIPKICNIILASYDRVATDTVAAKYAGFNPEKIKHIKFSEEIGVGEVKHEIIGDKFFINPFKPCNPNRQPVFFWEMKLRKIPIMNSLIFRTKILNLFTWLSALYSANIWYDLYGKKLAEKIIYNTPYKEEFIDLWERTNRTGKLK